MSGISKLTRSTGPKTQEGKAIASRNSMKTGVYSTQIVLPGESEADFQELKQLLLEDFKPEGMAEALLIHDLAVITWKKRRLNRMEHAVMMGQLQAPITAEEFFEAGLPRREEFKWALENLDFLTKENLAKYERHAQLVKGMGREEVRVQRIAEIKLKEPELFERMSRLIFDWMDDCKSGADDDLPVMLSLNFSRSFHNGVPVEEMMEESAPYLERAIIKQAEGMRYVMDHLDEINVIRQTVKDKRHLALVGADGQSRAMDDLNRAFYRILKELRTHQEWGRRHRVIDVVAG